MTFVAIIPAGGAGTRLWPLSRRRHPKFLLDLTGQGCSLLQGTVRRLAAADHTLIVTGAAHVRAVASQTGLAAGSIIAEPSGRNSMPAIALATAIAAERWGRDVIVGSFAADHIITSQSSFDAALTAAMQTAEAGYITTIGITPQGPETGFGYIQMGQVLAELHSPASPVPHAVTAFVEKPDATTAESYVAAGNYLWNAGMFVMQAGVLLTQLERLHPGMYAGVTELARAWDTPQRDAAMARIWPQLTAIAIDHAIAEPVAAEGGVAVVPAPAQLGWDDVGDVAALVHHREMPSDETNTGTDGVLLEECPGALVVDQRSDRSVLVSALGIDDLVICLTDDAILVTRTPFAQQVGRLPGELRRIGREDLR